MTKGKQYFKQIILCIVLLTTPLRYYQFIELSMGLNDPGVKLDLNATDQDLTICMKVI